ncbi:hypothetical protein ES332_D10G037400v1 [Gossypium tomentosum]|uniref:Uncharacterized protein n=1 Tax=Gossypium tomentosum TaxID=34277 RepID=A0A5D2J1K3_GOSTO|nr:hypothetical protein ES332_D10G037400v1 [Gossypium tomentosum]
MSQAGHFGRGSLLMPRHFPGILFVPTRSRDNATDACWRDSAVFRH